MTDSSPGRVLSLVRLIVGSVVVLIAGLAILVVLDIVPSGMLIDYSMKLALVGGIIAVVAIVLGLLLRSGRN